MDHSAISMAAMRDIAQETLDPEAVLAKKMSFACQYNAPLSLPPASRSLVVPTNRRD